MANGGTPTCCRVCPELDADGAFCRLLAAPVLESRKRLLTMPCDVQRLLGLRFRGYAEDVAREALLVWLNPAWTPEDIVRSYGQAPRDARLWLTSWAYLYLGRNAVRKLHRDRVLAPVDRENPPELPSADPAVALRVLRALDKVQRIDPVGYAMLLDFLRDRFDARAWCALLQASDATITDRKYLAIYRYAVYFHEVLESVLPHEAAVALATRRFSPGDPGEHAALEATRVAVANPALTITEWRTLYREGAARSLALLGERDSLGPETMAQVGTAFRRVLRVD